MLDASDASTATTLTIDGGNLTAYALGSASHSWFAVTGSGFGVDAKFGPLELVSTGVDFKLNSNSDGAADLIDWSTTGAPVTLSFPSGSYFELDATGNTTVTLTGIVTVTVGGFSLVRETDVAGPSGTGTGTVCRASSRASTWMRARAS